MSVTREAVLRFDRSLSASEVAAEIGCTRNAVIGHRYRATRAKAEGRTLRVYRANAPAQAEVLDLMSDGRVRTVNDIQIHTKRSRGTTAGILYKLVAQELIVRLEPGLYQDQNE